MQPDGTPQRAPGQDTRRLTTAQRVALGLSGAFILVVLYFAYRRVHIDTHNIGGNPRSIDPSDAAYAAHPLIAYLHIAPGVVYLLGACLQLSRRFRTRHYAVHRRMGRVVATCGLLSGVFVFVFAVPYAYGGLSESIAAAVFGAWFVVALVLAIRAIRRRAIVEHRRWMIRAFSVSVGVGIIRAWVGILYGTGLATLSTAFAIAFWLGLALGALAGELWLRSTPPATG
jgi:uncharacterized membrane protein YozB (DUF420 family)